MSAFVHYTQISRPELSDLIDEEWMQATLPEDDIPLPENLIAPTEEHDELGEQTNKGKSEKWTEMGLSHIQ